MKQNMQKFELNSWWIVFFCFTKGTIQETLFLHFVSIWSIWSIKNVLIHAGLRIFVFHIFTELFMFLSHFWLPFFFDDEQRASDFGEVTHEKMWHIWKNVACKKKFDAFKKKCESWKFGPSNDFNTSPKNKIHYFV